MQDLKESIPEENIRDVRTGDCLFFGSFGCNSMFVRFFTSSQWNHIAVAVRIMDNGDISLGPEGKLCAIDTGSFPRTDVRSGQKIKGVCVVDFEELAREYVMVSARHIKRSLLTPRFARLTKDFIDRVDRSPFPGASPFLAVWLGLPIERTGKDPFCSELAGYFYEVCAYPVLLEELKDIPAPIDDSVESDVVEEEDKIPELVGGDEEVHESSIEKRDDSVLDRKGRLGPMFGDDSLHLAHLLSPQILTADGTPKSLILEKHYTIWRREDDASVVLSQHVVLAIAFVFIGAMALSKM